MFEDMVYYPAGDTIVALDARTGAVRWETRAVAQGARLSSGLIVAGDKIISGRTCTQQQGCYIAAHDARTGKELWKFFTAAGEENEIANKSWGGAPVDGRLASTWGLTGSYDPVKKVIIWGVANPMPNTRVVRHQGNSNAIGMSAPADLYSNSTVALDPDTGKLMWYYQHLPGDDWDQDYTNERILLRTAVNPDPKAVKWINPAVRKGSQHDISVSVGEGGGLFALDRTDGTFLWAMPFPYDTPRFLISRNRAQWQDVDQRRPHRGSAGERHVICAYNTKSYWPMAYHPGKNSLYIPYVDNCLDMSSANPNGPAGPPVYEVSPRLVRGLHCRMFLQRHLARHRPLRLRVAAAVQELPPGLLVAVVAVPQAPVAGVEVVPQQVLRRSVASRSVARAQILRSSQASPRSTSRLANSRDCLKVVLLETERVWSPPATWCSGAILLGGSAR
jgi:outer membrane protein assembly factor BamB